MVLYTDKVVAEWCHLTPRRIRQLRDDGIIQEERPGLYDLKKSVGKYIDYLGGAGRESLIAERTRLTAEKRKAAEMDNALRRGDAHATEDIEKGIKTVFLTIRTRLLSMPAKLSDRISKLTGGESEVYDCIQKEVTEVLEEMGRYKVGYKEDVENE